MAELYRSLQAAILEPDPDTKCGLVGRLLRDWRRSALAVENSFEILPFDQPGRPSRPRLVDPRRLQRRGFSSEEGRISLLHAVAHIEFNAINIALDAVYRFRAMPSRFIDDWLLVASEEARHFTLLADELAHRGSRYGDYDAHDGLWNMVCRTRDDVLHRMALVPRVMEARGLDVTPAMIDKFRQFGDEVAAGILQIIYAEEVGHVRIGNYWFESLCEQRGLDAASCFRDLVNAYMGGPLRGPFNRPARIAAGFGERELEALEAGPDAAR